MKACGCSDGEIKGGVVSLVQLSILVHPDKNQDDADRAQKAFEGNFLTHLISAEVTSCSTVSCFAC